MSRWTQHQLKVPERNAMMAASAFLTPLQEVFQFLEDAISVQIGYAVGANDMHRLGTVVSLGVLGGFILGCLAASVTTALTFWPAAMRMLLAPGHHEVGCSLIPSAAAVVQRARGYWLLHSWGWPFAFASMALAGFLLGSREYLCSSQRGLVFPSQELRSQRKFPTGAFLKHAHALPFVLKDIGAIFLKKGKPMCSCLRKHR